jgi:hypothetical protein
VVVEWKHNEMAFEWREILRRERHHGIGQGNDESPEVETDLPDRESQSGRGLLFMALVRDFKDQAILVFNGQQEKKPVPAFPGE